MRALAAAGLLSPAELAEITRGLEQVRLELEAGTFSFEPEDEDIHTAIERRLTEIAPVAGGKLHTGRSRNDQVALDLRLYCRRQASGLLQAACRLVLTLARRALEERATLMPAYTHLQRAQPVSLGWYLLAHAEALLRDADRLQAAYRSADVMPLGSGAVAGSTLPLRRDEVARILGFEALTENTMDAVSDRDFALDLSYACLLIGLHLSRLGEDVVIWASSEFGFVELPDRLATGSSLMPQKKNPDVAELVRGRSGRALASLVQLATVLKGLPLTYGRDLQEDKVALFAAVDNAAQSLEAAELLTRHLVFSAERMATALKDEGVFATDSAERLVQAGMPFRSAHHQVATQVAQGTHVRPWGAEESVRRRGLDVPEEASRIRRRVARHTRWAASHPPAPQGR